MNIWVTDKYKDLKDYSNVRKGIRLRFCKGINLDLKEAILSYVHWLKKNYEFPIRIPIYFKHSYFIRARDGDMVSAIFFEPSNYYDEPYISIAIGDYDDLVERVGRDNAIATVLRTVTHELTHYFQWINNVELTEVGYERQAVRYADIIIDAYARTREHP